MKNIVIAIIIAVSFLIVVFNYDRYQIVIDNSGLMIFKYDKATGDTWRLQLPENMWVTIPDSGRVFKFNLI